MISRLLPILVGVFLLSLQNIIVIPVRIHCLKFYRLILVLFCQYCSFSLLFVSKYFFYLFMFNLIVSFSFCLIIRYVLKRSHSSF